MSDNLGRRLVATTTPEGWLAVEADAGARFAAVESLAAAVMKASFAGKPPVQVSDLESAPPIALKHVPTDARTTAREVFDLEAQRAKGAWWLPESVVLKPGAVNLPAYVAIEPRWAMNAAAADAGRVELPGCPDALACWALLAPFADTLLAPLALRGPDSGALPPAARDATWAAVEDSYTALGLTGDAVAAAVTAMRPGHGWSRRTTAEQTAARVALLEALRDAVGPDTVRRWRAVAMRPLLAKYYAKAKKEAPSSRAVLTKALQPTLAAFFAGDWLALLDYLGEQPAAGEEITTALPEPQLYVQSPALDQPVAAAEIHGGKLAGSPVALRVEALRTFWAVFDAAHAQQRPGMRPLNGMVGDGVLMPGEREPFRSPAAERLLPTPLLADVEDLWGGELQPRYPDRIVSARSPHEQMADAFGPALRFWHELAVTAWHICEGPYARTDLAGLAQHYADDVAVLAAMGTPVPAGLFADLQAAERRLGRPQEIVRDRRTRDIAPGFSLEISMGGGTRRDGFEILRDIIATHRRAWAEQHLDAVLHRAWEEPLREVARQLQVAIAGRGKPPTVKQFAKIAEPVANAWFGGDLAAVYAAVGHPAPVEPTRVSLLPYDRAAFCNRVFDALGGHYVPDSQAAGNNDAYQRSWVQRRAAHAAIGFVQQEELLDRSPTAQELGFGDHRWPEGLTFERYAAAVTEARTALPTVRAIAPADAPPAPAAVPAAVPADRPAAAHAAHLSGQSRPMPPSPAVTVAANPPPPGAEDSGRRRGFLGRLFSRS